MFKTVYEITKQLLDAPPNAEVFISVNGKLYEVDYQIKTIDQDKRSDGKDVVYMILSNNHYLFTKGEPK